MTEKIKGVISETSPVSLGLVLLVLAAIAGGIYWGGQISQRISNLEELRPMQVASQLAEIKANQARTITDLARVQMDISELRRVLGEPRQWDHSNNP